MSAQGAPPRVPTLPELVGKPSSPPVPDPAWQPPSDPLQGLDVQAQASVVHREIPLVTVATGWDVPSARRALEDLVIGLFDAPAQLADQVMRSDSRVQSGLNSRLAILGRPVDFVLPRKYRDSELAKECRDAFIDAWPTMAAEPIVSELQRWAIMLGFGVAQILWDTSGEYAIPHPLPWHPRYTYYHWTYRCYVALTLDGQEPILPGNASWMLHAPHGDYRGWMRGAASAITPWWLARHYALRDWARYSERHGLPMIKAKTPAVGDPQQQAIFRASLANIGQETVLHLPQNPPPALSHDVELLEARDTSHEGFRMLIQACDMEITLALLAQNLTSEVKEGSFAAARVHADVRQSLLESDARALASTIYMQLARPFAAMNFGNPDLAPRVIWDVTPYEDAKTAALTLMQFAAALNYMRVAGFKVKDVAKLAKGFGFDLGELEEIAPMQVEVAQIKSGDEDAAQARARVATGMRFAPTYTGVRVASDAEADQEIELHRELLAAIEAQQAEGPARRRRA